jgi:hypothetical protein
MKKTTFAVLCLLCQIWYGQAQNKMVQTVRGTVVDKNVQIPLPGATVIVLNSNPLLATSADGDGKFRFQNVPIGRHAFQIRMMGYKDVFLQNIEVATGKENVLTISMEEDLKQVYEVLVMGEKDKTRANNVLAVVSAINMRSAEINRYAGSRQDPSRMASNFAGVAGGGDQRNDIIVRGNSPWGVLWRMEGVDIPNPNHFAFTGNTGGAFSILNNNLLANSDFLTGAFPAEYGNKTAAVFDVRLRKGNNEKREHTAQIGLNGFEFTTEGPLGKPGAGSYMASGRLFSFAALDALGVSIGANGVPQFQDGTFKISLPTKGKGQISIWGMGGQSSINLVDLPEDIDDPMVKGREQLFTSGMFATGLNYEHHFGEKTLGNATVSVSGNWVKIDNQEVWTEKPKFKAFDLKNIEKQAIGQYIISHKFNARNLLKAGTTIRMMGFHNYSDYFDQRQNALVKVADQKGNSSLFQAYAQWQHRATEKLTLNPGVYFQRFAYNGSTAIEPRFSATYLATDRDRFSAAAGLHSQTSPLFLYQSLFLDEGSEVYRQANRNLNFSRGAQAVFGYQRNLGQNLHLKVETYYQHQYDVPVSISRDTLANIYSVSNFGADYGFFSFDSTVNQGKGRNYGLEMSLEKSFTKGYYFLANLSLVRAFYTTAEGIERNSAFDLGHVANLLAGKEFRLEEDNKKLLSIDLKLTHSGGRRYLPIDVEASKRDGKERYDLSRAYEPRLKDYFRTDLKITYQVNRPKANHNFFVAADNVLNTQNVLTQAWNRKKQEVKTYYQLGIFPYLGYRVQF